MRPKMDLDDLVLTWTGGGRPLKVSGAITALSITRTIEGASTIVMTIVDPHGHLFSEQANRVVTRPTSTKQKKNNALTDERGKPINAPTLSGRAVEIILDDVAFRLTKVTGGLDDVYTLTFEDRIIYWMRRKKGAISASRASVTRAEFILKMVREIKTETIPFICPQLSKKQPQAKPEFDDEESLSMSLLAAVMVDPPPPNVFAPARGRPRDTDKDTPNKKKGVKNAAGLTVKGKRADQEQKRNMNEVMEAAWDAPGATKRSVKAAVLAVIAETLARNEEGGDSTSTGILQLLASTARAFNIDPMSISDVVDGFMTKGYWGKGSAVQLAKDHPDWPAWKIAQYVQGSGAGQATEGRANYGPWMDEAQRWMDAYSGDTDLGAEGGGQYRKSYQFKRDADENAWEAGLRLADEVQWRLFPIGRAVMYSSELDLFRRQVAETVNKGDQRVLEFPWEVDWNKNPNECSITVLLKDWEAYPGTCIMVDGYGAPDGRWLVTEMERDWFDERATFTLKQPLTPKKEPAAEVGDRTVGVSGDGTGGEIGTLYNACKHISSIAGQSYVWGGGHSKPLSQTDSKGLDCSGSTSLALWRADMWPSKLGDHALVSGDFKKWGNSGRGHLFTVMYNATHVWIQFEEAAGMMYKRFDTSPWGDTAGGGPRMRKTERTDQASFQKRHWPGM